MPLRQEAIGSHTDRGECPVTSAWTLTDCILHAVWIIPPRSCGCAKPIRVATSLRFPRRSKPQHPMRLQRRPGSRTRIRP